MKKLVTVLLTAALSSAYALPRPQSNTQVQQKAQPGNRPNAIPRRALVQEALLGFYVTQFHQQAEVTPEVMAKVLPFLQQFVQDRFDISQRRNRAMSQLRQAIARGGSDEELKRAVHDVDEADADALSNQQKFLSNVDPLLNPRQQAKLRIFQVMADNRMRQILSAVQNPNANQNRGQQPVTQPEK
jgi:hypothetical protein